MIVFPAIDILGGRAVRLHKGDYDSSKVYADRPIEAARRWVEQGGEFLHVVDLDGAREGRAVNLEAIAEITSELEIPVQAGGGVRDLATVQALIEAGTSRVVVGTAAMRDPEFLTSALEVAGDDRIVVAVDSRAGEVSVEGWTEGSGVAVSEAVTSLGLQGARRFLFTAIETDGTMEGPDLESLSTVALSTPHPVIASGGIGTLSDISRLVASAPVNVEGVIVGKALYEGRFQLAEAIEVARS